MIVTGPFLQMSLGASIAPDATSNAALTTGAINQALALAIPLPTTTKVIAARLLMGLTGATGRVTIDCNAGTMVCTTAGTRQIETAIVTAAAGCTAAGNLACTLTGSLIAGSPLAFTVPLTPAGHPTAIAIAAAIAAALNALPAANFGTYYTAASAGAAIHITDRFTSANDATLNLAITAGLGVSALVSSLNSTAGVAGALVDFPANLANKDAFGGAWAQGYTLAAMIRVSGVGYVQAVTVASHTVLPPIQPGTSLLWQANATALKLALENTSGPAIVDLLIFGQ